MGLFNQKSFQQDQRANNIEKGSRQSRQSRETSRESREKSEENEKSKEIVQRQGRPCAICQRGCHTKSAFRGVRTSRNGRGVSRSGGRNGGTSSYVTHCHNIISQTCFILVVNSACW